MSVIRTSAKADPDGIIRLALPAASAGAEYDLQIVLTPKSACDSSPMKTPEELGWPPGYFENVIGASDDDTFLIHPQPPLPPEPEPIGEI